MKKHTRLLAMLTLWMLWAVAHAGTVTYVYSDPQGTPLAEADASGTITATFDYRPYGGQALGAAPSGPGYTGHVNDPETGFVYMQARYYDPSTGRFLSVDPVGPSPGDVFGFNRYDYTSNNPINHTDPDGRCIDGVTCGTMLKAHVDWRMSHPGAPADGLEKAAFVGVGVMLTASGLGAVVEVAEGGAVLNKVLSDSAEPSGGKTFTTYMREKPDGTVYSGKTSGKGAPEKQVANRIRGRDHQAKTAEGYGPAKVDKNSSNPDAIRGREQQLIEQNGGARSQGGTSGNAINGVSPTNPKGPGYRAACAKEFGC